MAAAAMEQEQEQAKNQGGRPTDYTPELAEEICDELTEGKSLRSICKEPGMPHRGTVGRWLDSHTAFAAKYARARLSQADLMDDRILETIAKIESGELTPEQGRVIIAALQWRAAKLEPKKYGDQAAAGPTVNVAVGVNVMTPEHLADLAARKRASIERRRKGESHQLPPPADPAPET